MLDRCRLGLAKTSCTANQHATDRNEHQACRFWDEVVGRRVFLDSEKRSRDSPTAGDRYLLVNSEDIPGHDRLAKVKEIECLGAQTCCGEANRISVDGEAYDICPRVWH